MSDLSAGGVGSGRVWGAGEVARLLGIPPVTLRTWDARYGVGPARRVAGVHRRYSRADIERLRTMQRLLESGVPARDAAQLSSRSSAPQVGQFPVVPLRARPARDRPSQDRSRSGLPLGAMLTAAGRLQTGAVADLLDSYLPRYGMELTWRRVMVPALRRIERRWLRSGDCMDVENALTEGMVIAVDRHISTMQLLSTEPSPAPVLLTFCPGEAHALPVKILRAALMEAGIPSVMLASGLPLDAAHAATRRVRPRAVVVWAMVRRPGYLTVLRDLRQDLDGSDQAVVAAGPGWPPSARAVNSLQAALSSLDVER